MKISTSLTVIFTLFLAAPAAGDECAWVLWTKQSRTAIGIPVSAFTDDLFDPRNFKEKARIFSWRITDAFQKREDCLRGLLENLESTASSARTIFKSEDPDIQINKANHRVNIFHGSKDDREKGGTTQQFICLPSHIDPREKLDER